MKKLIPFLLIIATIYWSFSDQQPSKVTGKTKDTTAFSLDNALYHLKNIAKKPHYVGTPEHRVVRDYIKTELTKLGLKPEIQVQSVINKKWRAATTTENVIAKIKGKESGNALLLLSHYDSSPHSSLGASDAGSGVVTILEGVRAFLAKRIIPKNDIIILISDAEELGLLGAKAFVEHHPWAKETSLVLNFEARGSGGPSYMLMETNGENSRLLSEFLNAKPNFPITNSLMYSIYKKLPNDTDLTVFRENGNINGFNFAFIGDHFDYHTEQDSFERADKESILHQADYLTNTLNYFANADLTTLNSDVDHVYVNFPFVKMIHFPYSWVIPLTILAFVVFFILYFIALKKQRISVSGSLKGFLPFIIALISSGVISFLLWKGILIIHPKYNDILHGFTYNGYYYIAAFTFLNAWLFFKIYKKQFQKTPLLNISIAPIFIWLLINALISVYLTGAGFFIIPVFMALLILSIEIFMDLKKESKAILYTLFSIPTLYIFAPLIKMFPVGLGLKSLFISAIFIVLVSGIVLPILIQNKSNLRITKFLGLVTIVLFLSATFKSSFTDTNKNPNSLNYVINSATGKTYWATYDKTLDVYTKQILGKNPESGTIAITAQSKYGNGYSYHKKADNKNIPTPVTTILKDTIIGTERFIELKIDPKRKVNTIQLIAEAPILFNTFGFNTTFIKKEKTTDYAIKVKKGTIASYFLGNSDENSLKISFSFHKDKMPKIQYHSISFDLLQHPNFSITPRSSNMMPTPFVINDAIITINKITL